MAEQDEINKIIEATDIVAIVSQYVKLEKSGKNYKGLCPFHNEDTPSFLVNPEKRLAHCFGCGGGGNPLKFLMQIENINFPEAIKKLADFNGIEYNSNYKVKDNPNEKYYKIMQLAVDFYKAFYENTKDGLVAKEYLHNRGLTDELISEFDIGLSGKGYDNLYKVLKESNYLELDMTSCGLVDRSDNGTYYDLFKERIMFPLHDEQGHPVGFSARNYLDNPSNPQKYINTRDTIIFNKSDILYNLHRARPAILKKKRVILHEGQMDVIATYRSGLQEVICTMGVALSINQINRIKRYTDHVIIMYDSDGAGINASKKAANLFKDAGFKVNLVLLEGAKDPDEFINKYGIEEYKKYVDNNLLTIDSYTYITSIRNTNLSDTLEVEKLKSDIFYMLQSINSQTLVDKYLERLSLDLNFNIDSLKIDYNNFLSMNPLNIDNSAQDVIYSYDEYPYSDNFVQNDINNKSNNKPISLLKKDRSAENKLFYYAMHSKNNSDYIFKTLEDQKIFDGLSNDMNELLTALNYNYYLEFDEFDQNRFIKILDEKKLQYFQDVLKWIDEQKNRLKEKMYSQEDLFKCFNKINLESLNSKIVAMNQRLTETQDDDEKKKIINEIAELNKEKKFKINRRNKK